MSTLPHVPVLIAGAGPVGLALAADLAWRGIESLCIDPRQSVDAHPRAISIGVRSMEYFRRLGLAEAVIDAGVPRSQKLDVAYVTRLRGREIFRFEIPSIEDLSTSRDQLTQATPELAASPYYKTWTAQSPLERVLRAHLGRSTLATLQFGTALQDFREGADGVEATLIGTDGTQQQVAADYLVGCDGASSRVRQGLGIRLEGRGTLGRALGIHFRAPGLRARLGDRPAVMYWIMAPGCGGTIYMIDGGDEWVYNRYFAPDEPALMHDAGDLLRAAIGDDQTFDLLSVQEWFPRQLVAEKFATQRVFLAGDACHLFVPTGGFGMNTGIGDAVDLAWKIAATKLGWGGPQLLSSYDLERRPIGLSNTLEAADNYARSGDMFLGLENIEHDDAAGIATRRQLADKLPPKIKHFAPIGVHLGYSYDGSPLIVPDGTPSPPRSSASYEATARPGHRAPHAWISEGKSTLDMFGASFVLATFTGADTRPFAQAALDRRIPLRIELIDDADIAALYGAPLVLVRPDGHVCWRGTAGDDSRRILDAVRGA